MCITSLSTFTSILLHPIAYYMCLVLQKLIIVLFSVVIYIAFFFIKTKKVYKSIKQFTHLINCNQWSSNPKSCYISYCSALPTRVQQSYNLLYSPNLWSILNPPSSYCGPVCTCGAKSPCCNTHTHGAMPGNLPRYFCYRIWAFLGAWKFHCTVNLLLQLGDLLRQLFNWSEEFRDSKSSNIRRRSYPVLCISCGAC